MAFSDVKGKTAIITGAGAGINFCFAKLLLSKGCNVVLADLALRPESQELINSHSSGTTRAVFQQTDVRSWQQLERMFETCEHEFEAADIVCPGAGVYEPLWSNFWIPPGTSSSQDAPSGDRYAAMDINVTHPIRTTQLAISHFLKHKRPGSVVHIASIAAQVPHILVPLYIASKFAISGFVRSLAGLEAPKADVPKIRVTAVAPGVVKTPLWTDHPEKLKWVDESVDDWVTPEEVAERMLDLLVKEEYVGGTVLEVAKGHVRKVDVFNDPGPPRGPGLTVSNRGDGREEVWDRLAGDGWGAVP